MVIDLLSSRNRVLTTLAHEEPDRVPVDLGGRVSGIHIKTYRQLLELLEIDDPRVTYCDFGQQLALPCDAVLERFNIDTRYLYPPGDLMPENYAPVVEGVYVGYYDQFGVFWGNDATKPLDEILYYDPVIHPLAGCETPQQVHAHEWPDGTEKRPLQGLREKARALRADPRGFALVTPTIGCVFEYTTFLFGFARAMKYLRTRRDLLQAAMEKLLKYWSKLAATFLSEVEGCVDVVCLNGDLAEQSGPLMNLKLYASFIKPVETELVQRVRGCVEAPINYHSCGSVSGFIPHFVDIGYDAVNPVQIAAADMEPRSLKARFGDQIAFWGGLCDSQSTLPFGTPETIRAEIGRNLALFKPGGGYVASSIHNITAEVAPENVVAMFDATQEFGPYKP